MNRRFLLLLFCFHAICVCYGQSENISLHFKQQQLIVEKGREQVVLPVEVEIRSGKDQGPVSLFLRVDTDHQNTSRDAALLSNIEIRNTSLNFQLPKGKTTKTFYVLLKEALSITAGQTVVLQAGVTIGGKVIKAETALVLKLVQAQDLIYTLSDYLKDENVKLGYVTKVESSNNILSIYGYHEKDGNAVAKRQVALKRNEVYSLWNRNGEFYKPSLSLIAVPVKVRPGHGDFKETATSGLNNLGVNFDFFGWKWDRYFSNGNKSTHRLSAGLWGAPSVEELDSVYTGGALKKAEKSKQLFIASGLTITYSYNNITFGIVPVGFDFATSSLGQEWVYNKRRWWGFGIGIEPKLLSSIVNK
jgi:hypothetical protein